MTSLERWRHKVHEIPRAGLSQERSANAELRADVARELDVAGCEKLEIAYRLKPSGRGAFDLTGTLRADLIRTCIVTLEPIAERIREPLDCRFVPPGDIPAPQAEEQEALAIEEIEAIENDILPIGRIAYEVLAASLDPYPRKEGEHLDAGDGEADANEPKENPFAALARLRGNTGEGR